MTALGNSLTVNIPLSSGSTFQYHYLVDDSKAYYDIDVDDVTYIAGRKDSIIKIE